MAGQPACSRSGCRPRNRLCTTIRVSGAAGILLPAPTPPLPRFAGFASVDVVSRQPLRPLCAVAATAPDSLRRAWDPTRKNSLYFTEAGISTPVSMRSSPSAWRALKSAIAVSVTARVKPPRGFRSSVACRDVREADEFRDFHSLSSRIVVRRLHSRAGRVLLRGAYADQTFETANPSPWRLPFGARVADRAA